MSLTSEQLAIIRESTIDDEAYQRVVEMLSTTPPPKADFTFILDFNSHQSRAILAVMDAIPLEISIKDTQKRFRVVNTALSKLLNFTHHRDLLGKTNFDVMTEENARQLTALEQQMLDTQYPIINAEITLDHQGKQQSNLFSLYPVFDTQGVMVAYVTIHRDITERKQAEHDLEAERNLLRAIIDNIHDKIYVKDRQSRFITANAQTIHVMNHENDFSLEKLIGTTDFDYMPHDRAQRLYDQEQEIMETGQAVIDQELLTPASITQTMDLWFLVSKVPIYNDQGEVIGIVGVNRDITAQKLASERAVQIGIEREKSQFLADFITESSHEFRTPISIIRTASYLLLHQNDADKKQGYVAQISEQTERLEALINDLNLMVKLDHQEHIEKHKITLETYLHKLVEYGSDLLADEDVSIDLQSRERICFEGDEQLLTTALSKILHNAIRYSDEQSPIRIMGQATDNTVIITIQDNGVGMTAETTARAFQRFFREDIARSTRGFGLGLPIAQRILELHNGTIEIESQIDVGTNVHMRLPRPK